MEVKRYRCNMGNFSFSAVIGGKQRWLRFSGSKSDEGYYATGDVAEQRAIESSRRYMRGEIRCVGGCVVPDEVMSEAAYVVPDEVISEAVGVEAVEVVNGIATVQAAREYLVDAKGAKASELNNKEAVLAYAESVGVRFSDW